MQGIAEIGPIFHIPMNLTTNIYRLKQMPMKMILNWKIANVFLLSLIEEEHFTFNSENKTIFLNKKIWLHFTNDRSSHPEVSLRKGVLKICSKFTGENPCWSVISIKLLYFIEIALWHGCFPVNSQHIFNGFS